MNPFILQKKGRIDLSNLYKNSDIYLYSYARYAFLESLRKLNIKSIYIPSFICRDVLSPINKLNIEYHFYEVDIKLNPIIKNKKCDAILMINYFGFSNDIEPFLKYKKKYNSYIIEDNAHGLFSKDEKGKLLGTRGDIGLLSIRKTVSLPNGAALLINNETLKKYDYTSAVFNFSNEDVYFNKKQKLKKLFFSKYLGIMFLLSRRALRYLKTKSSLPLPDPNSEKQLPENSNVTPLLENKQLCIDLNSEIERRRKMYSIVESFAKEFGIYPIFELTDNSVPFEFAFITNETNSEKFEQKLLTKGYFILPWPDLPDEINLEDNEFYKNVKVVPFLW